MNRAIATTLLLATIASLSACSEGNREASETIDKAEGKILERSLSDDMLPYDTVISQPPLADPEEAQKADEAAKAQDAPPRAVDDSPGQPQVPGPDPTLPAGEASAPLDQSR